jgi:hypothetical protein
MEEKFRVNISEKFWDFFRLEMLEIEQALGLDEGDGNNWVYTNLGGYYYRFDENVPKMTFMDGEEAVQVGHKDAGICCATIHMSASQPQPSNSRQQWVAGSDVSLIV